MSDTKEDLEEKLLEAAKRHASGTKAIEGLAHLSGGASQETWSFDAIIGDERVPLILRRTPGGQPKPEGSRGIGLPTEAKCINLAVAAGVPAPPVRFVLDDSDGLGEGYVMDRIEGETLARRILRDTEFDEVRPKLARQCGEILAQIHSVDPSPIPDLTYTPPQEILANYRELLAEYGSPRPVIEFAMKWLEDNMPSDSPRKFVHGDFRHGNLMIHPETGVAAVLDWEIAHVGDPMEDLGWICVNVWRFGHMDKRVGGFGDLDDMIAGYEAVSGEKVDRERVKFWEVFGNMKWAVGCLSMYQVFRNGPDRTVERAAIGRRSSENEIDILYNLAHGRW